MSGGPVRVFVGAGSNIEPQPNLRRALAALRSHYGPLELSPVYRSPPLGFDGPDFLNLVVAFRTADTPERIVGFMESLHRAAGRRRDGARRGHTLDLDLLLYDGLVQDEGIVLPRPDILRYAFVLAPLADLAPDLEHPGTGRRMAELWADFDGRDQPLERMALDLD